MLCRLYRMPLISDELLSMLITLSPKLHPECEHPRAAIASIRFSRAAHPPSPDPGHIHVVREALHSSCSSEAQLPQEHN